ncbi:MAG: exodeoxyribonuclease V subunit gamma [Thioalkalivibrionaceae bacterium]
MLNSIPGNRLEYLVDILDVLLRNDQSAPPLEPDPIVVAHPGLAQWLRLQLAMKADRGIAMNLEFPLPREWIWDVMRRVLGPDVLPQRSPLIPEVMTWRIFRELASPDLIDDPLFAEPTYAWQRAPEAQRERRRYELAAEIAHLFDQIQLYRPDWADAFENGARAIPINDRRETMPDPDWQALLWQRLYDDRHPHIVRLLRQSQAHLHRPAEPLPPRVLLFGTNTLAPLWLDFLEALALQGTRVHLLHLNPCPDFWDDLESAKSQSRRVIRSLGTPAPITGSAPEEAIPARDPANPPPPKRFTAPETNQHPQRAKINAQEDAALSLFDDLDGLKGRHVADGPDPADGENLSNADRTPSSAQHLLTALGAQGQAFIRALRSRADDTPMYVDPDNIGDSPMDGNDRERAINPVSALQSDLYHALDTWPDKPPRPAPDERLVIVRAGQKLREVQGLHDWILARMAADATIKPRDIVILCPDIEAYAPHLRAVFATTFVAPSSTSFDESSAPTPATTPKTSAQDSAQTRTLNRCDTLRLPCTIADRNGVIDDPDLNAFNAMLDADRARFSRNEVLDWLASPALLNRLGLDPDDVSLLGRQLAASAAFWGIDKAQREKWLNGAICDSFGLHDGIDRSLLAYAHGSAAKPVLSEDFAVASTRSAQNPALLRDAAGREHQHPGDLGDDTAETLAKAAIFIKRLQEWRRKLDQARPVSDWSSVIDLHLRRAFFAETSESEPFHSTVRQVLADWVESTAAAKFDAPVGWSVVREVLKDSLAQAASRAGRGFLRGAITAASLVPMRSLPFRVVAVLGLDATQFPRPHSPSGFDRIAAAKPRELDRTRRTDDRELFLEALLSARDALWLSYQGFDAKDRSECAPSLVLSLLIDHLEAVTTFSRDKDIYELPMHAFDPVVFRDDGTVAERPTIKSFAAGWLTLARLVHRTHFAHTHHDEPRTFNSRLAERQTHDAGRAKTRKPEPSTDHLGCPETTPPSATSREIKGDARETRGLETVNTNWAPHDSLPDDDAPTIALDELARAYAEPVSDWGRHHLDLGRKCSESDDDSEAFEESPLERYRLVQDLVNGWHHRSLPLTGDDRTTIKHQLQSLQLAGRWPRHLDTQRSADDIAYRVTTWIESLHAGLEIYGKGSRPMTKDLRHPVGTIWLTGSLDRYPIISEALVNETDANRDSTPQSQLLAWRPGQLRGSDMIAAWLKHLAANLHEPTRTATVFETQSSKPAVIYRLLPIASDQARRLLDIYVRDVLSWRLQPDALPPFFHSEIISPWLKHTLAHHKALINRVPADEAKESRRVAIEKALENLWSPPAEKVTDLEQGLRADPLFATLWADGPPPFSTVMSWIEVRFQALAEAIETQT